MKMRALWIAFSWSLAVIPAAALANDTVFQWLERMDAADMLRGQQLCDDFGDWYMSEVKEQK